MTQRLLFLIQKHLRSLQNFRDCYHANKQEELQINQSITFTP